MEITLIVASLVFVICAEDVILISNAVGGTHFHEFIDKGIFFENARQGVHIIVSIDGKPDLPHWLRVEQRDDFSNAILFGTPASHDIGMLLLNVHVLDKETYHTVTRKLKINITDAAFNKSVKGEKPPQYQFEFKLNTDAADIFNQSQDFLEVVKSIWPYARYVTLIEKPSHRNGQNKPFPGMKEGVFVRVGGTDHPPSPLKLLHRFCLSVPANNRFQSKFVNAGFELDWCESKEYSSKHQESSVFRETNKFHETFLVTKSYSASKESYVFDLLYLFIPIILGFAFILMLTCSVWFHKDNSNSLFQLDLTSDFGEQSAIDMKELHEPTDKTGSFSHRQSKEVERRSPLSNNNRKNLPVANPRPPPYRVPPHLRPSETRPNHYTVDTNF